MIIRYLDPEGLRVMEKVCHITRRAGFVKAESDTSSWDSVTQNTANFALPQQAEHSPFNTTLQTRIERSKNKYAERSDFSMF